MTEPWNTDRLRGQIAFVAEIDKLKNVLRKTLILDGSRLENTAEHSWHVAVMAQLLIEHANEPGLDANRIVRMLLLHDLVEIDAGDTFAYDAQGYEDKAEREQAAANRLFGLLPADQRDEWMRLWREFEDGETTEARFAAAIDRLHPVINNFHTGGHSWLKHGVRRSQVVKRLSIVSTVSEPLWQYTLDLLRQSVERGILLDDPAEGS